MTTALKIGDIAPNFVWHNSDGEKVTLKEMLGKSKVVLYFYPKDNTPGCTIEARGFAVKHQEFLNNHTIVVGVSRDSAASHEKFSNLCSLPFPLIADQDGELCNTYGVIVQKSMFGKKYMGLERSTFLIGDDGKIRNIWRNVSISGHVDAVLKSLINN